MKKIINIIGIILIIIGVVLGIYASVRLVSWYKDSDETKKMLDKINDIVDIDDVRDEEDSSNDDEKLDFLNMNLEELEKINKDVVGWIRVLGTNVNYPFVRGKDNDYYLTHSFDKSYNKAGWVFLDYRNDMEKLNRNNIIYGHNRLDGTMFGSLKNILNESWYRDKSNNKIIISSKYGNSYWQVFSVYVIPTTDDYLKINFKSDNEYQQFIDKIRSRSIYDFDVDVDKNDRIFTLSTCFDDKEKIVIHAKEM